MIPFSLVAQRVICSFHYGYPDPASQTATGNSVATENDIKRT